MGAIEHLTIPLSVETADAMRSQVAAGDYADLGELVEAALLSLGLDRFAEEHPVDDEEFRRQVLAALAEYDRDPSSALTIDEVKVRLATDRAQRARRI